MWLLDPQSGRMEEVRLAISFNIIFEVIFLILALSGLIAALICSGMFLITLHCSYWCVSHSCKFHVVFLVSTSIPHHLTHVLLDHSYEV